MKLYMGYGEAWDLFFRSFLVFVFVGALWLKFLDPHPYMGCMFWFFVPVGVSVVYFWWGWRQARIRWEIEQRSIDIPPETGEEE